MTVKVLFFAMLREISQADELDLEIEKAISAGDLFDALCNKYPDFEKYKSIVSFAVNSEYCDRSQVLNDGDELALIPPISGGRHD